MGLRPFLAAVGCAILMAGSGCLEPAVPGEPVATFEIVGVLERNDCGHGAVPVHDPLQFDVEIRRDGTEAFWRRPDRRAIAGRVNGDDGYRFEMRSETVATEQDGVPQCVLRQHEQLDVRLLPANDVDDVDDVDDGDGSERSLDGTNEIELGPTEGSDCAALRADQGGPFLQLPCRIAYTLDGAEREPF